MRPTFIEVLQANHIVMFDPKWQQIKTLVERNVDNIWTYVESPVDPLQWMGAVRMRVQTAYKNITIIHK